MPSPFIINWKANLSTGFVEGSEVTCLGQFGIVLEVGTMEDGLYEWLYVGLSANYQGGPPYDYLWVPHEIVSHACPFDPTVNLYLFYLIKLSDTK